MTRTDLVVRPATVDDLAAVADLHVRAREAAVPAMPPSVHPADEVRAWVHSWDLRASEVWLACRDDRVVGYSRSTPTWLDDLYVDPDHQGAGVGSTLLDLVKAQRPDGFCLWVFESNTPARGFYARHGLVELERTDGHANEERRPDVRMAWPGQEPLAFFRGLIDEVDEQLGDLLARRTALTRVVQAHKPSAARDPEREAEVVRRVAAHVPELGERRVARIVQEIISESLDAAGD